MNKISYIVLLLMTTLSIWGQVNVSGVVIDESTLKIVNEADVYLVEKDLLQQGRFEFEKVEKGEYTFVIFAVGYTPEEQVIFIESDTVLEFTLKTLTSELTEVVIQDQKDERFALQRLRAVEGTSIYAGKKSEVVRLEKMMGNIAANNSRQIYAQVAGLNIYEGNDGGLQLAIGGRGLDPNRTANFNTRQNGYDISADVLGYPESYYTPPAEALDEIQIIRGAASLQYGTQFGGLINFKTHQLPRSKTYEIISRQTIGSFGFFNSFNGLGLNRGKWSFQGYYNYKQGDGYRANSEFSANNVFGTMKYRFSESSSIRIEYTFFGYLAKQAGGLTDTQFALNPRQDTRERNWFKVNWNLYNALFKHKFSVRSEMTMNAFALDASRFSLGFRGDPTDLNTNPITALDEQRVDGSYLLPRDLIRGNFRNFGAEARFLTRYFLKGKRAVWLIGSKYYNARNSSFQGPGSTGIDPDFSLMTSEFPDYANQSSFTFPNQNLAIFSENIFYLNDKLSITPGFRYEYIRTESIGTYNNVVYDIAGNPISNVELEDNRVLPRSFTLLGVGFSYQPSEILTTYANISQNYRSITFSDIRTVNPTFIIDPDIGDERGFTTDLGLRGKYRKQISYDAGIFGVFYNDRIGIILNDRANRVRKNIGNALIYGFESLIDVSLIPTKKQAKLSLFSNLSITDSRYTSSQENNVVGKRVEFIPLINWKGGLNGGYRNFLANAQFTYISKQFTDVQNSTVPEEGDSREGVVGPIPAYHIMDLSLSYKWKLTKIESGVNNVLNHAYFTRRATGYPGPGIIPSDGRSFYLTLEIKI